MDTGFEQFLHCDVRHGSLLFGWFFATAFFYPLSHFRHLEKAPGKKSKDV
jgi:hypothetical protein